MGAVPMAVPHTRPIAVTEHANNVELLTGDSRWRGELRIPSSAQALLELRLGEWGHDALGYVAHIPHYLAQLEYPRASAALLEHVERGGRLTIDLSALHEEADEREAEVTRYLAANEEVNEVVAALEQQYRRVHPVRGERQQPAGVGTSRCRPARRSASSSSSSSPDSTGRTTGRTTRTTADRRPLMPASAGGAGEALDLESLDVDLFRGAPARDRPPAGLRRPGGGPGADRRHPHHRAEDRPVHSMHSYFLRPGDTAVPIIYDVERLRNGRSFSTRRIVARQHGHPIYFMTANFQVAEDGFEHQDAMPAVSGGPEGPASTSTRPRQGGVAGALGELRARVGGPRGALPRQLG